MSPPNTACRAATPPFQYPTMTTGGHQHHQRSLRPAETWLVSFFFVYLYCTNNNNLVINLFDWTKTTGYPIIWASVGFSLFSFFFSFITLLIFWSQCQWWPPTPYDDSNRSFYLILLLFIYLLIPWELLGMEWEWPFIPRESLGIRIEVGMTYHSQGIPGNPWEWGGNDLPFPGNPWEWGGNDLKFPGIPRELVGECKVLWLCLS